jgi:pyridoxamine--pyruvate transaminase
VLEIHGVLAAVESVLAEGLPVAQARHRLIAEACRVGVRAMGLRIWPARDEIAGASGTSIRVPDGLVDTEVRDHIRAKYLVQLSVGDGAGNILRIGHAGDTARAMWMIGALAAVGRGLADMGADVQIGAGVEAALAKLSAEPAAMP